MARYVVFGTGNVWIGMAVGVSYGAVSSVAVVGVMRVLAVMARSVMARFVEVGSVLAR